MSRADRVSLVNVGKFKEQRDGSCKSRWLFMCCSDQHRSHLEHITGHNDFTKNGVHYVTWLDVLFNVAGRPPSMPSTPVFATAPLKDQHSSLS